MQLEHVNLVVKNIPATLIFYQAAFPHWRVRSEGSGQWYGKARNWLHFGDSFQYLSFSDHGEGEIRDNTGHQVGLAHFGYQVQNLDALIERLNAAGFAVDKVGTANPYRKNVYFIDPTGYEVEFIEYLSDIPIERNNNLS